MLTHLTAAGEAHMVDVSGKPETNRRAIAQARLYALPETIAALATGTAKGDAFAAARLAGIMAAKQTAGLIPLCHPLPLSAITVALHPRPDHIEIEATVTTTARTGVEMEALTAVSIAALTLYDMAKAIDRGMTIEAIRVMAKEGGRSG